MKKRVLRGDADVEGGGAEEGDSDNDKDDGPKWVPKHARDVFDPEFTPFLIVNGVKSVSGTQCDECGYCTPSVIYMKKHLREKHFKEVIRGSTDTKPSQRFNTLLVIETNDATHIRNYGLYSYMYIRLMNSSIIMRQYSNVINIIIYICV